MGSQFSAVATSVESVGASVVVGDETTVFFDELESAEQAAITLALTPPAIRASTRRRPR
jgi:hypothetical protein